MLELELVDALGDPAARPLFCAIVRFADADGVVHHVAVGVLVVVVRFAPEPSGAAIAF